MPFSVAQLIEGHSPLVCVNKDELVSHAFSLMIEHDYSQLPVIDDDNQPLGMVTHEGILRGIKHFNTEMKLLRVRDVIVNSHIFNLEDDLYDLLDRMKSTNAVLIIDPGGVLVGIVTSYDTTEFFRKHAENLMLVEDIETIIKDFIRAAYSDQQNELSTDKLSKSISQISRLDISTEVRIKSFEQLSLSEYISLLCHSTTWTVLDPVLDIPKDSLRKLLDGVRKTRNDLAHFRNEITSEQQDQLHFCAEWLVKRQLDWENKKQQALIDDLMKKVQEESLSPSVQQTDVVLPLQTIEKRQLGHSEEELDSLEQISPRDSRYAPLADYLLSQPGKIDQIRMSFDEIESIINGTLPNSARIHRAWWSNDTTSHPHAKSWLESGWRSSSINMSEGKVTFIRVKEREKAYIEFFSSVLIDLSMHEDFPLKKVSPDGSSWMIVAGLPSSGPEVAYYLFSFSRERRMRVELYIDTNSSEKNKQIFDQLARNKQIFMPQSESISWERMDQKRASRIAIYHSGQITDSPKALSGLKDWAVKTMVSFHASTNSLIEQTISNVMGE